MNKSLSVKKNIQNIPLDYPVSFSLPLRIAASAWAIHVPFGMFLIDVLRPAMVVELGTYTGVSYCAFCQAVRELGLDTRAYAIDTWKGDEHAGFYGYEVLADLQKHHDPLYGEFSRLVQSTFDDAVQYFSDASIDLLHIDGLHTYEAVKHDFETWLPKLSKRAVVLFHDINVRERNFGVWRLWEELSAKYPSFFMIHGHGLGVLAVGEEYPKALDAIWEMTAERVKNFRELFFQLGRRVEVQFEKEQAVQVLGGQLSEREALVHALSVQSAEREARVQALNGQLAEREARVQALNGQLAEREARVQALNGQLAEREARVQALNGQLAEREAQVHALSGQLAGRETQVQALKDQLDRTIIDLEKYRNEVITVAQSRSWKLTEPLRRIMSFFRGVK